MTLNDAQIQIGISVSKVLLMSFLKQIISEYAPSITNSKQIVHTVCVGCLRFHYNQYRVIYMIFHSALCSFYRVIPTICSGHANGGPFIGPAEPFPLASSRGRRRVTHDGGRWELTFGFSE